MPAEGHPFATVAPEKVSLLVAAQQSIEGYNNVSELGFGLVIH